VEIRKLRRTVFSQDVRDINVGSAEANFIIKEKTDLIFKSSYGTCHKKQTYADLFERYGKSAKWIQKQLDAYTPPSSSICPQSVFLVIDGFFLSKRNGVLVFRSPELKKNLGWYSIEQETVDDYELGLFELGMNGFEIQGVTIDGKPGVIPRIEQLKIPVQMCHFHQVQIVLRYITRNPRIPASQELKELVHLLPHIDQESFTH